MSDPKLISTFRIGQLTGSTAPIVWPQLVDPLGQPLLNDLGACGAWGVNLGANCDHKGRLFIFFGDAAVINPGVNNKENSDIVAWSDDSAIIEHGGHLATDLDFTLPVSPGAGNGQNGWRFCTQCHGLFWPGARSVCPKTLSDHNAAGLVFWLPYAPTAIPGQSDWRFCIRCSGLFWAGDPYTHGVCPASGPHVFAGENFVLPTGGDGQKLWRYCVNCRGLFGTGTHSRASALAPAAAGFA